MVGSGGTVIVDGGGNGRPARISSSRGSTVMVGPAGWVGTAGPIATAVVVDDLENVDDTERSGVIAPTAVLTMSTGAGSDDEESDGGDAGVEPPHAASVVSATISQIRVDMFGDQR
jgi:hypothetical protein